QRKATPRPWPNIRRQLSSIPSSLSPGRNWPSHIYSFATLAVGLGERASTLISPARGRQLREHSRSRATCRRRYAHTRIFNSIMISIGKEQTLRCRQPFAWHRQTRRCSSGRATWQQQKGTQHTELNFTAMQSPWTRLTRQRGPSWPINLLSHDNSLKRRRNL